MATGRTVRQVKQDERLRRSQNSVAYFASNAAAAATATAAPAANSCDATAAYTVRDCSASAGTNKDSNDGAGQTFQVEGHGPYKPVPPPKPLAQQNSGCFTPPPYRMPPYPLYNEPNIPGAATLDSPTATSTPDNLHTHSSKFPIEREVILSSADKNSKIPILHEYMKKSKGAIAPDLPPKQMAAWTQGQNAQQLQRSGCDQTHSIHQYQQQSQNNIQQVCDSNNMYRATYHPDFYNHHLQSTAALSRAQWQGDIGRPSPTSRSTEESTNTLQQGNESGKNNLQKEGNRPNNKTVTKTYHTIKDLISSKFKTGRDSDERNEQEGGLNNAPLDDIRGKSSDFQEDRQVQKVIAAEQGVYGRSRNEGISLQHSYGQQLVHQHLMTQQQQQSRQAVPQTQIPQHHQYYSSHQQQQQQQQQQGQEVQDQMYTPSSYVVPSQRPSSRYGISQPSDQHYVMIHNAQYGGDQMEVINERCVDTGAVRPPAEKRSAQQIERDNLRQRTFEARRAASQPQLACEDDGGGGGGGKASERPQARQTPVRHGSHGNIAESAAVAGPSRGQVEEPSHPVKKDASEIDYSGNHQRSEAAAAGGGSSGYAPATNKTKDESKMCEALTGAPRKRLESEIGKIEGVYNVAPKPPEKSSSDKDDPKCRKQNAESAASSDYDKSGQGSSNVDSGRGSAAYSSGRRPNRAELATESSSCIKDTYHSRDDSEWVDVVENELRTILEPKLHELSLHGSNFIANSTLSESMSSMSPPLPPLSQGDQSSPSLTPRNSAKYKKHHSLPYGSKPEYGHDVYGKMAKGSTPASTSRWQASSNQKHRSTKKPDHAAYIKGKQIFGLESADMTSTTTRSLDLESILDNQSDSEGDISTTDARAIRKQLEGLENMYSEVLKLLGVRRQMGRYQPSDPRFSKRRYGSMSSLPSSSVSSRPIRDKRRAHEDRRKVKDIRGINKRFQRLESHVVTLARSVAHLSSEMRTQHLMIQEMENIRGEIATLRAQTNMLNIRAQSVPRGGNNSKDLPSLTNPTRVKKLTKFFGDEPPLLRLFLRKLGYEKYANVFENERVGMVELPYLSEERLQKMGVPLGPRLRILQEAQISVCKENTLAIV